MRSPSQTQRSTQISNKSSAPAVSEEARKLPVRRAIKRTRGYRGLTCPLDRKVAHRHNRVGATLARVASRARADHRAARKQSIRLGRPWHMRERAHFFVDRNRTCI